MSVQKNKSRVKISYISHRQCYKFFYFWKKSWKQTYQPKILDGSTKDWSRSNEKASTTDENTAAKATGEFFGSELSLDHQRLRATEIIIHVYMRERVLEKTLLLL